MCSAVAAGCSVGGVTQDKAAPEPVDFGRHGPYEVGTTTLDGADGPVEVFYPAAAESGVGAAPSTDGPFPVVVHSHDTGSDRLSASTHLAHLAGWGLVAAAPDHAGGDPASAAGAQTLTGALGLLTDATIERGSPLEGVIDTERVGVEGHGAGATSARVFAADPQVDVVALLAPEPTEVGPGDQAVATPLLVIGAGGETAGELERSVGLLEDRPGADIALAAPAAGAASAMLDSCPPLPETAGEADQALPTDPTADRSDGHGCDPAVGQERSRLRAVTDHLTTARYLSVLGADGGSASAALDPAFVAAAHPGALSGYVRSSS